MAAKQAELEGIGTVRLYKRRDSRAIKITLLHDNQVRVSLPVWLPYRTGLEFVKSRREWIVNNRRPQMILGEGNLVGKNHRVRYISDSGILRIATRVLPAEVRVTMPTTYTIDNQLVQAAAKQASIRALRAQARQLLPIRLDQLAKKHSFSYGSVHIKRLKSRWGSCSPKKQIALNLFLMQLPWELIDYVLLHELTHTQVLHHGPEFWQRLEECIPRAKALRKQLRAYQPALY